MQHAPHPLLLVVDHEHGIGVQPRPEERTIDLAAQERVEERTFIAKETQFQVFEERAPMRRCGERDELCRGGREFHEPKWPAADRPSIERSLPKRRRLNIG